jgi:hypothetical protein
MRYVRERVTGTPMPELCVKRSCLLRTRLIFHISMLSLSLGCDAIVAPRLKQTRQKDSVSQAEIEGLRVL